MVRETGPSSVMKVEHDYPVPKLQPGGVLVKNKYSGINFIDTSPLYRESERRIGLALEALPECADSSKFSTQHVNDTHVPSYVINTTLTCRPKLFGTGVTAGYAVETRYDAPSIDVVVKVNNVNATVRVRSSDPRLGYPATAFLNEDKTDGWIVAADTSATGDDRDASGVALLMDARNPTLVEIDVSGDGGTRATYWLLVTKNSSQFSCPGRNANPALVDGVDTTCLGKESTVETVPAVVQIHQTTTLLVRGKDRAGKINAKGGEADGIN